MAPVVGHARGVFNVWIEGWEMQCCGDSFIVGDFVQWPAVPVERSDWLERLFKGREVVVHYAYRAHGDDEEDEPPVERVSGRVERIDAVTSAVVRTPIDAIGHEVTISEGTAELHPVRRVHRGRPLADTEQAEFFGYLVMLDG